MEIVADTRAETTVETNFVVSESVDAEDDPEESFPLPIDPELMDCIIDWMFIGVIIFCLSVIFKTQE